MHLVCCWWNLERSSFSSYFDWLEWFKSLRMGSKIKDVLEGVYRNHLLFADKKPRKDYIFDDIVLRSFTCTFNHGLQLHVSSTAKLTAYTDADKAGYLTTHQSTSDYYVFLGDILLSCVVYMYANPFQHQRTKHIEIDVHFVRDFVAWGQVRVLHFPTRFKYAAIFSKGLLTALFLEFHTSLNILRTPNKLRKSITLLSVECVNICKYSKGDGSGRYDCSPISCAWKAPRALTGLLASTAHSSSSAFHHGQSERRSHHIH
ncbi:ribonuclease H-like domain-containing protein, partial [Tanacetum coccineum]